MSTPRDANEMLATVGDGRWWERADCFGHSQARGVLPGIDAVMLELRQLFPADICVDLVQRGRGERVYVLFQGASWSDRVDELLQLGADLSRCPGWSNDDKLIADLRNPDAYEAARFEVGVWAGLQRVGLAPEREPAANRAAKRADFRVRDGRHLVAIELKSLADPRRARNLDLLYSCLFRAATGACFDIIGSIELAPSPELDDLLDDAAEGFLNEFDVTIWPAVDACLRQHLVIGRHEVSGVGTIIIGPRDPADGPNVGPRIGIHSADEWTIERAAARVVGRVNDAGRQLVATEADLRAAVVWGGLDHFPCDCVAAEIVRRIGAGLRVPNVDYIGIVNCHRKGPRRGWTTEVAVRATRDGCPAPEAMTWPAALTAWGLLHRVGPPG